ncbi:MAG TPA: hypothetical protein DCS93_18575 [Microscillaceae bacterium]|nr:hypothetical protein [Microscillaceae bacterium]
MRCKTTIASSGMIIFNFVELSKAVASMYWAYGTDESWEMTSSENKSEIFHLHTKIQDDFSLFNTYNNSE